MSSAAGSDNIVPEQLQDEPNQTKDSHQVMPAVRENGDDGDATRVQTMVKYTF